MPGDHSDTVVTVGKIGKPYGVKGWVHVYSYTDPIHNLIDYPHWQLHQEKQPRSVTLEKIHLNGNHFVVKFEGIEDRNEAALLTNATIQVSRENLPTLSHNEFYWSDLQGLSVIDLHGKCLGIVNHLLETGANDVLVVIGEKRQLIPYLPHVVLDVDLKQKTMRVDWDEI